MKQSNTHKLLTVVAQFGPAVSDHIRLPRLFGIVLLLVLLMSRNECMAQSTVSIFTNYLPSNSAVSNTHPETLGVKFWSTQSGTISAIKFYRGRSSPRGYVAMLYSASGTLLGSVSMAQESGPVPGWQQATFATPIPIAANTSYIAAYYSPGGQWAQTQKGLNQTVSSGPLNAPASSQVGGNGIYTYGNGFPTSTYRATNYFVDVAFTPVSSAYLSISVSPTTPTIPNTTPLGAQVASVSVTWSDGSPFTGTLAFGPPNYNDGGVYALDSNNNLIINPSGPGVSSAGGSVENVTLVATQ